MICVTSKDFAVVLVGVIIASAMSSYLHNIKYEKIHTSRIEKTEPPKPQAKLKDRIQIEPDMLFAYTSLPADTFVKTGATGN